MTDFGVDAISRCFVTFVLFREALQYNYTASLESFNRYTFYLAPWRISSVVVHLGFEKPSQKSEKKFLKKSNLFKKGRHWRGLKNAKSLFALSIKFRHPMRFE
jgi:hypothetical protein